MYLDFTRPLDTCMYVWHYFSLCRLACRELHFGFTSSAYVEGHYKKSHRKDSIIHIVKNLVKHLFSTSLWELQEKLPSVFYDRKNWVSFEQMDCICLTANWWVAGCLSALASKELYQPEFGQEKRSHSICSKYEEL